MTNLQLKHRLEPLNIQQEDQENLFQQVTLFQNIFLKNSDNKINTKLNKKITTLSTDPSNNFSLLSEFFESLHKRLARFMQCQLFFTQCDIFNDILDDITKIAHILATTANSTTVSFLYFCEQLIFLLVSVSSHQISLPRHRHHLTKKLLRFEKEPILIQLGFNARLEKALQGQIEKGCQDIVSFLSGECVHEAIIESIIRRLILFLEEDHLYYRFFNIQTCVKTSQSNILTKTLQFFIHVLKSEVVAQRCWTQSSCKQQQRTQLNENVFLLLLKAITQFLPLVSTLSESYDKTHNPRMDIRSALISCFQTEILTNFLNLLECYPISREVITIIGQHVASLITKPDHAVCVACLAQVLLKRMETPHAPKSSFMWYLMQSWNKLSLLAKISLVRGVISLTSCKQKNSFKELQPLLFFLKSQVQPENHLITFYAFQGIYVWVTCVQMSVSPDLQNNIQNDISCLLQICMDYWNSSFKPLASLSFRTWEACVSVYQHVKELVDMLRKKFIQGDLSKFSLLAFSSLISQKTTRVYVQQDSSLFLYTLYCMYFKKCRNAAIQIILSILQNEQNEMKQSSLNLDSSKYLPSLIILSRILCETYPLVDFIEFKHRPTHPFPSSTLLKEILVRSFLPILQKKNISIFFQLLDFIPFEQSINKGRLSWYPTMFPSFYYWEITNAAFLSSLKELGYGTWDSYRSNASLVFSLTQQTNKVHTISLTVKDLAYGLLSRNDLLKYYVLNIVCQRRKITEFPPPQEWLLVKRFCKLSVTSTTLEFTNKNLDTVKKFLHGAFEAFKPSKNCVEHSHINSFKRFFLILLGSLGSFISCKETTLQLSLLCYFYQCLHPFSDIIKYTVFSFMHTEKVYCQLIPYIFSSWDNERTDALQCLTNLHVHTFDLGFNRFTGHLKTLLYSLKHQEQSQIAEFIIQSLCRILSTEIQKLTNSSCSTTQQSKMSPSDPMSTQFNSDSLSSHQLNLNIKKHEFLNVTKHFSIPFKTTLSDEWIQQSLHSHEILFTLFSLDRLEWYVALIQKKCINKKLGKASGFFLLITSTIQQLPLSCDVFINSFPVDQCPSLRQWITAICLKIVNSFFSCVSCLFTTPFHTEYDIQPNDTKMRYALTNATWDQTTGYGADFFNSQKICPIMDSSKKKMKASLPFWVILKNVANTLHKLFQWIHLDSLLQDTLEKTELTCEFFTHTALKLITLTLGLEHPAAIDCLSQAISSLASCTAHSQHLLYKNLTRIFLSSVTALFIPTQKPHKHIPLRLPPPLRRSSCLGKCVVALLLCDASRDHTMNLFEFVMNPILHFLESFHTNFSDLSPTNIATLSLTISHSASPTSFCGSVLYCNKPVYFVYNLNVCRSLIQSSLFVTRSSCYLSRVLSMSLHYCIHPVWSVRNAATLLFATTTEKMTGIRWDVNDTFEFCTQSMPDEFHDENCRHGTGFSFCTESQRRFLQRNKGQVVEDIFTLYPTLEPLFIKLLDPNSVLHPSLLNEGVVINISLFLLRVQFVEKQCPLLQSIQYWRTNATNAFTRTLAACILSPFIDTSFYQQLQLYNTNNALHGLLFSLLDHTGTMELTSQNVEDRLQLFQDTYHHTLCSGNRLVAPLNVALYLQCVETLYQRLESISSLSHSFKSLKQFMCSITAMYLSCITQSFCVNGASCLSPSYKDSLTVTDATKDCSQQTTLPTAVNALQAYFPGQSLPFFITALRLFCCASTLEDLTLFLTRFHSPHVSQHINLFALNSKAYCFLEELFRVLSLRFTKETQPMTLTEFTTLFHILSFFFLHTLVQCQQSHCCTAFLTNTAREKLSSGAFTTLLCFVNCQRLTIHRQSDQSLIDKKTVDIMCEDYTATLQHEPSLLSHLANVVTEALKHSICHKAHFGDPLSQCLLQLKFFTYNSNTLLETIGSIYETCSVPSAPLAHRLIACKILTNIRLSLEPFNESLDPVHKSFHFRLWTFTAFLLTDDHEEISRQACTVVKDMLYDFTTFTYLKKKCVLLVKKIGQFIHPLGDTITTVSLQYLLRVLFLIFDHKEIIATLTENVQDNNELILFSKEDFGSSCFDKEPSCSNIVPFLYYVYSIHAENHNLFKVPFETCSLRHPDERFTLETKQGIEWVSQTYFPFKLYLNPNCTTQLFRLVLHNEALSHNSRHNEHKLLYALYSVQVYDVLLPLCFEQFMNQALEKLCFTYISVFPNVDFD